MRRLRTRCAFVFPICCFLIVAAVALAPARVIALDYENCAIVMFERDVMTLPEGLSQCSLDSATVSIPTIESILASNGASIVAKLAPDFELADTLAVGRLGVVYKTTDWSHAFLIEVPTAEDVDSLVTGLQGVAGVVYAEPAAVPVYADGLPYAFPSPCTNDPVFAAGDQWQFQNFGLDAGGQLDPGTDDADIDLIEAWEITSGCTDTMTVAVLDNGVWGQHEDLGVVRGKRVNAPDVEIHGTFVAGLVAALADNSIAISGVNPGVKIYSGTVWSTAADAFYPPLLKKTMKSVVFAGFPIANMSFSVPTDDTVERALRDAYNAGVLLVASQTTDNRPPGVNYPARYKPVLAVGYTDHSDQVPDNQMEADWVDIVAPGFGVISLASWLGTQGVAVGDGTSFSAPLASGVASLLLLVRPDLDNDDLREVIVRSADGLGPGGWDSTYGNGRLNAQRALEMVLFPNEIYQGATQSNNYVQGTAYVSSMEMHIPPATTWIGPATRYEVRRDVTFPITYNDVPEVWGRGVPTDGYNTDNPNYAWKFCEVVPGSVTTSGCTLRTYVYQAGSTFYPADPDTVHFAYTVVGRGDHHYRIQSFVSPVDTSGVLYPMPEHWAVGCPGGDADTIVVKVAMDATEFEEAPAKEEFTLSQPANAGASLFPDCSPRIADDDAVLSSDPEFPNGCYKTSFRIANFAGFCGVDSLRVRFRGGLLGYVPINVRSPDMVAAPSSRARVSLADLSKFAVYYPSPPKDYNELADFVAPTGVGSDDFGLFVYHYANGGHQYTPPSLIAGDGGQTMQGNAVLEISDGPPFEGDRTLVASVRLEAPSPYEAALLTFRCNNPRLELVHWEEAESYGGETICSEAVVGDDRVLAIGVLGRKNISGSSAIGVATLRVLGADSLILDVDDFTPVISDILLLNGVEGPMSSSRIMGPEVHLTNSLRQNFPNPFNPETTIIYSIKETATVTLAVYDVAGRRVRELVDGRRTPGIHRAVWDGTNSRGERVASGVYFCKLTAGSFTATKKMVMLK